MNTPVEITAHIIRATARGYVIDDGVTRCTVPKTEIMLDRPFEPADLLSGHMTSEVYTITMPEWLAHDRGLI